MPTVRECLANRSRAQPDPHSMLSPKIGHTRRPEAFILTSYSGKLPHESANLLQIGDLVPRCLPPHMTLREHVPGPVPLYLPRRSPTADHTANYSRRPCTMVPRNHKLSTIRLGDSPKNSPYCKSIVAQNARLPPCDQPCLGVDAVPQATNRDHAAGAGPRTRQQFSLVRGPPFPSMPCQMPWT